MTKIEIVEIAIRELMSEIAVGAFEQHGICISNVRFNWESGDYMVLSGVEIETLPKS